MKNISWLRFGGLTSLLLSILVLGAVWSFGITTEVPVGGLKGVVVMDPSGKPLPNAEVIAYPTFEAPEDTRGSWTTRTNEKGEFAFKSLPAGLYNINAYGKIHTNQDRLAAFVQEGKTERLVVKTTRNSADLDLHANQRVFLPTEKPDLMLSGYTDEAKVKFQIFQVPYDSVFQKRSPENLVRSLTANRNDTDPAKTAGLKTAYEETRELTRKDVEGHFVEQVQLAEQPEGLYLVKAEVGKEIKYAWITVTKIAMVTKSQGGKTLAFVTDLQTGTPVPGAKVSYMSGTTFKPAGETIADGTLDFSMDPISDETRVVVADSGSSRAFTWFYGSSRSGQGKTVLWAQTDRPVYRPGDTVEYKIVARDTTPTGYHVPQGVVDVTVSDSDETVVDKKQLQLSPDGTVHGSFKTDSQVLGDSYTISMAHGESNETHYVSIVSYRKPEFRVTVKGKSPSYIRGETARYQVHVETYTGEPSPGMDVTGWVYQQADWSFSPFGDEDGYDPEEYGTDYLGNPLQEVSGKTDENGDCVFSVSTSGKQGEGTSFTDAVFTLDISVQDASGRSTQGRGKVKVVRGEFNLVSEPERYIIEPGQGVNVKLKASWNEDGTPVSGRTIEVDYGHERWTKSKSIYVSEGTKTVELNQNGEFVMALSPTERGEFRVKSRAKDRRGNTISSECSVWVETGGSDYDGPIPDVSLTLDKANYQPTDSAKILIRSSHPGGSALVTVEADGVLWSKTVPLVDTSTTIEISGLAQFAPNAIVNVSYIREKEYYEATKNLKVDLVEKKINLTIEPDRAKVEPGQLVTYKIKSTDQSGNPVRANVALGIVDESIYAIAEDYNDPLKSFYPRRWSSVQSAFSFPSLYLDGEDKNPKAVRVRRNFQDTAYWNPEILTSELGEAQTTVRVPDNLTEWRATATAFTTDTRIGRAKTQVVAKRDLMVRLSLPAFLVEGDSQTISARVSNTSDRRLKIDIKIQATGTSLTGKFDPSLELGPDESRELTWTTESGTLGEAIFKVIATEIGGTASDGVEQVVPVRIHGRQDVVSAVGETSDNSEATVILDPNAVAGSMQIQVAPTLLGTLVQALPSLIDYPYGCTEQTMSRFVPAVLVSQLMRQTGYRDPTSESRLPKVTHDSLVRVKQLQSNEGGWGWWEYDSPDFWMTAYVLEGLWRVGQAGVDTSLINKDKALEWAEKILATPDPNDVWQRSERIDLACAVLLYKPSKSAQELLGRMADDPKLSTESLAKIVVSLKRTGSLPGKLGTLYKRLINMADETRDTMHWPDSGWYEPTATGLEALALMEPNSPRIAKVFRYLQTSRRGDSWTSTRDTARIIVSASEYLRRTKELTVDENVVVKVNGREIARHHFSGADLSATPFKVELPFASLQKGANKVSFVVKGTGKVYYSVALTQVVRMAEMPATSKSDDFTLTRAFYKSAPKRLEDGTIRMVVGNSPVTQAKSGEVLRCRITVTTKKALSNVMAEVPVPSNMRIIDDEEPLDGASWDWWWSRSVFRDEKAVFFGSVKPGRPQVIEFAVRAESAGTCVALPASLFRMYQPDERVTTSAFNMEVLPK